MDQRYKSGLPEFKSYHDALAYWMVECEEWSYYDLYKMFYGWRLQWINKFYNKILWQ